jgi:hypothetical protein
MDPRSICDLPADALFASALQPSDALSVSQIRQAIAVALDAYGGAGCAGRVAQEFGDHPETAANRMHWARASAAALHRQPAPTIRRVPTASGSVRGGNDAPETAGDRAMDDELVRDVPGQLHDLMVAVGPTASGIIAGSRRRLLALLRAGDGDGAAREMEQHLAALLWMRRVSGSPSPTRSREISPEKKRTALSA